jgi:hypothetical protein
MLTGVVRSNQDPGTPILIIRLAVEGGGAKVFGREVDGVWSYWHEGNSIQEEDDEDNDWKRWTSQPVANLADALPSIWVMMSPIELHPSFIGRFREQYEVQLAKLSAEERVMQKHRHGDWLEILSGHRFKLL